MRNKAIGLVGYAAATLAAAHAIPASAADKVDVSASLTGATDYVWRGVSQSDNHAAIFATANASLHGFYIGAGTENVDFSGIKQEYDLWGGYTRRFGPVKVDVGMVRYGYVDAPSGVNIDTLEGKVAVGATIGKASLAAAVYYTGNYFGSHNGAAYTELSGSYPITGKLSVSAGFAHQEIEDAPDYNTWNAGLSYQVLPKATVGVQYIDTDITPNNRLSRARAMGSFTLSF